MLDILEMCSAQFLSRFRSCAAREAEIIFLRQQLLVLKRCSRPRHRLTNIDRLILVWLYRLFPSLREAAIIFKPDTLVQYNVN